MSENIANLSIFSELSQKIYTDEIEIDGQKILIRTRAQTARDLEEITKMAGKDNDIKYLVFLVQRCLVEPKASQLDVESWKIGIVNAIAKKITDHSTLPDEKKNQSKNSQEVTKEK